MTTLRRELIQVIDNVLKKYHIVYEAEEAAEIADAVLELRAFKQKEELAKKSPEAAILLGLAVDGGIEDELEDAVNAFERDMRFNPLPWGSSNVWEKLIKFVVQEYKKDPQIFFKYKSWQEGDGMFDAMKNKQIYDHPDKFIASFPDFLAKTKVETKQVNTDESGTPRTY